MIVLSLLLFFLLIKYKNTIKLYFIKLLKKLHLFNVPCNNHFEFNCIVCNNLDNY